MHAASSAWSATTYLSPLLSVFHLEADVHLCSGGSVRDNQFSNETCTSNATATATATFFPGLWQGPSKYSLQYRIHMQGRQFWCEMPSESTNTRVGNVPDPTIEALLKQGEP